MLKYHSLAISSTGVLFGHPVLEEREREGRLWLVGPNFIHE